ncbi:MAG TPA: hypothetical protein VFA70_09125 [Dehalococcoidia bacterium]|jgi:hypothetical protein|nr:hypothetical protein [Dehalococcoidia bacterium]
MQVILGSDEAWSLMTIMVSQMIDKAGLSSDGKTRLRKWRTDRAEGTVPMNELGEELNEALGSTLDEKTYRLLRRKGGYVPSLRD